MSKDYLNHNERVEFFTKFISKIIYYNDRLIIIYNTKPNDSEETVINNKEDIEKIENTIKNLEEKSRSAKFMPNDKLMAESMLSNSNTKIYMGAGWVKLAFRINI